MPQADNFPAMLKTGEYVLRKEAVDEIGKDKLDMMNNVDRLGYVSGGLVPEGSNGHSAIDELLALNTLSSQRNVDMTRDTGMYDDGGMAKDPLEIAARQMMGAQGDIGGIGMRDTTSLKSILNDLNRMQLDYKTMERQRSRYPDEKSFKDYKENRVEAGDSMGLEEIVRILSRAAGATQQMPSVKGYGNGGETYSYGSGQTEMPNIADIYKASGYMPNDEQLENFQSKFLYDPSEEETTIADYQSNVKGIRTGASSALEKNRALASSAGGGFSGFGERERMISDSSSDIYQKGDRALSDSSRGLYDSIKGMREDYIAAGVTELGELGEAGTEAFTNMRDLNQKIEGGTGWVPDVSEPFGWEGIAQNGVTFTDSLGKEYAYFENKWHLKRR